MENFEGQTPVETGVTCRNCGNVGNAGETFCSKCGTPLGAPAPAPVQGQNPYAAPAFNAAQMAAMVKTKVKGRVSCVFGMISGFLSVLFGLITLAMDTGSWEMSNSYGGDAYTGIQNAAAQTANNVQDLAAIAATGLGFLLISFGLFVAFYFMTKMKNLPAQPE